MSSVLLITRPRYDVITRYFHAWSRELVEMAKNKGMNVCDLRGKKATRSVFESYARKREPSLVVLNGHGDAERIVGQDGDVLVDLASALPCSLIYARSCDAGERLGPALVDKGTAAFIGYRRKFAVGFLKEYLTKPVKDPIAVLFLGPSNLVVSTLIKGHSAQEAHARSQDAMYRNYRKMICSAATFEERYASRWLWGNIRHQVLHGNPETCVK